MWNLIIILLVVAAAIIGAYLLFKNDKVKSVLGEYLGGAMLSSGSVDSALIGAGNLSHADLDNALVGAAQLHNGQLDSALIGGNPLDWVDADPDGAIFQGGCCGVAGADDYSGGAIKKPTGKPMGERVDFMTGVMTDKDGAVTIHGEGRLSNREATTVDISGKVTLDSVKVKDTVKVNGNVAMFNCTAKNVEIAGAGYLKDCVIEKLLIKNKKTPSTRPSIKIAGGDVKNIELTDKSAKVEDFVVRLAPLAKQ